MNTDQKYAGKGDSANLTEQTAQKANQTANTQAKPMPTYRALNPKTAMLNTVHSFFGDRDTNDIVEVINDLTRDWLKIVIESNNDAERCTFNMPYVTNVLFTLNKITEFIVDLQQRDNAVKRCKPRELEAELIASYKEQITLLNQIAESRKQTVDELEGRVSLSNVK